MTLKLVHSKVSTKADGTDPTLIQPSDWNAQHDLEMDAGHVLGRMTTGQGPLEQLGLGPNLQLTGGNLVLNPNPRFAGTSGLGLPAGTTALRDPAPIVGVQRYNTDLNYVEYWDGTVWQPVGTQFLRTRGATVASANTVDFQHVTGTFFDVSGSVNILQILLNDGERRTARFLGGPLALVHAGGNVLLPNARNVIINPGDVLTFRGYGSYVILESYVRQNNEPFSLAGAIEFVFDGGGAAITAGAKGDIEAPFNMIIQSVTMLADQVGSLQADIMVSTFGNYDGGATHPASGDTITGGNYPAISGATKFQDNTLSSWNNQFVAGNIYRFSVRSASTIQRCTISLKGYRT